MFKTVKDILVLCEGNNCRSQIAEGYLRYYAGHKANVYSAGIEVAGIHPLTVQVLAEDGIDISSHTSNKMNEYTEIDFDLLLTVCNSVTSNCSDFPSKTLHFHYNFPDPVTANGTEEEVLEEFRKTRDLIKIYCAKFLKIHLYSNAKSFENFQL